MADETQVKGEATVATLVNLRQGAPSTQVPVVARLAAGTALAVVAVAIGEAVQGVPRWYRLPNGDYVWAGACAPLQLAPPDPSRTAGPQGDLLAQLGRVPLVVDLSHNDGVLSFAEAKAAGVAGVIHKATTGATGRDDAYRDRRAAATSVGLLWGAYHFGTGASISDQVDNFLQWAAPDATTLVALDFEENPGNQMTLDGARAFCQLLGQNLGRKPVVYGGGLLKSSLGSVVDPFLGAHRLWLAQYGSSPAPQRSWESYWLWQYTDGTVPLGCRSVSGLPGDASGRLDCNHFDGAADTLAAQWTS